MSSNYSLGMVKYELLKDALLKYAIKHSAGILKRFPDPLCRLPMEWLQVDLRREIEERIREGEGSWSPDPKVFGIGLSRTGTTSLSHALEQLGYTSLHWSRNGKVVDWPEFIYADAATDIPCSARFESLYHTFKDSKFIYTVRDLDQWRESIVNHYGGMKSPRGLRRRYHERSEEGRSSQQRFEWEFHDMIHRIQANESLYAQHETWKEAYQAFDERVRKFFEDKPEDRFLEMSITGGDRWEPLCSFLGHEVPDQPFPHANASEEKRTLDAAGRSQ